MSDPIIRRLLANYLVRPSPDNWLVAADRFEELGEEESAKLWRRRGTRYTALREHYDAVRAMGVGDAQWRQYGLWEAGFLRYEQTVRVHARHLTLMADVYTRYGFDLIINVNVVRAGYVTGRLLNLIDRLTD